MRVARRAVVLDPGTLLDAGLAVAGTELIAVAAWVPLTPRGTAIAGPPWLLVVLPLLTGAPLAARRRYPLLMWTVMWAGISMQALITRNAPTALGLTLVLIAGSYSLAAYSTVRRAVAGLAVMAIGATIYLVAGHAGTGGQDVFGGYEIMERVSRNTVFVSEILALWLTGVFVRTRRHSALLAARNAALDRQAEQAVAAERARIAREMHDIIAHHLSVGSSAGRREPRTGEAQPGGPRKDRIQRAASADRDAPAAQRLARAGRERRPGSAAGYRRASRPGDQRPLGRPAGVPGH